MSLVEQQRRTGSGQGSSARKHPFPHSTRDYRVGDDARDAHHLRWNLEMDSLAWSHSLQGLVPGSTCAHHWKDAKLCEVTSSSSAAKHSTHQIQPSPEAMSLS